MRILHVDSARGWRGGQNQVLLSAIGMSARGHTVAVACQEGGILEKRARAASLTVHPIHFRGDLWPPAAWVLSRAVAESRPEIIQLHDPHAIGAGLLAAPRSRLVATRRAAFPLRGVFSRLKYQSCRRVIAVSQAIASRLEAHGIDPDRIRTVYEGVPDHAPEAKGSLAFLGVPEGAPVVGNVAALAEFKGHATLLEAAARVRARMPEVRFVLVGEGSLRSSLEERAGALGLSGYCFFAGFREDLERLIPAFTIFCLPSDMEGLGTSLLDAMAFSRPIVATAAGGIPEAVLDGVTGLLVPSGDPSALSRALLELLENPETGKRMGEAGRRRYEERFTADHMVQATLKVYEEIL
jgi:glycosyltransferase involved in cell wall biosynthesis